MEVQTLSLDYFKNCSLDFFKTSIRVFIRTCNDATLQLLSGTSRKLDSISYGEIDSFCDELGKIAIEYNDTDILTYLMRIRPSSSYCVFASEAGNLEMLKVAIEWNDEFSFYIAGEDHAYHNGHHNYFDSSGGENQKDPSEKIIFTFKDPNERIIFSFLEEQVKFDEIKNEEIKEYIFGLREKSLENYDDLIKSILLSYLENLDSYPFFQADEVKILLKILTSGAKVKAHNRKYSYLYSDPDRLLSRISKLAIKNNDVSSKLFTKLRSNCFPVNC